MKKLKRKELEERLSRALFWLEKCDNYKPPETIDFCVRQAIHVLLGEAEEP